MRKTTLILLVSLLWLNLGVPVALADGMILPLELDANYLGVRTHHVTVSIDEDGYATTRVEQEFYNPYSVPIDGQYLFPVPPEAIPSHFWATVNGQVQPVIRQDAATTNETLYAVVAQQRDPSLLQYVDWESLAFDLSLSPGESCQMVLEYEQVLVPAGGLYRYRYILSTERYSSQLLEEVSLTVDVHAPSSPLGSGLANLYSPSHPVTVEWLDTDRARAHWEAQNVRPSEDFEFFFAPAEGGFGSGLLTGWRNEQDYFLFLFAPGPEPAGGDHLPKDILFVLDRSGSMSGEKIGQARNALHFILGQLGEADRFSIVSFNDRPMVFAPTLQPASQNVVADARHFVDQLTADGGTDLDTVLQTGLEIMSSSEHREAAQIIIFLTDGLPTVGITNETLIVQRVAQSNIEVGSRLHVFGVGYDVNTHLLDRLAADNGGTVTYVQPGENLEAVLTEFYGRIAHPVLTDVELGFEGIKVSSLYPPAVPDLFHGSSLLLIGRYQPTSDAVTVRVRGRAGAEEREYVYRFDLSQSGGHDFVPRLWATRRVGALLDQVRVEGESQALVNEIRDLGLGYGVVTPYTTFVIEGQDDGAASAANMALYSNQVELNQVSGQVTIQARVQNSFYQQATQANLATGANTVNYGRRSLAQVPDANQGNAVLNVDLSLLQGQGDLDEPLTIEWIDHNVGIDRSVTFGSEEYFALADDPAIRSFLQSGPNVVFAHKGEVISIQETESAENSATRLQSLSHLDLANDPDDDLDNALDDDLDDNDLNPDTGQNGAIRASGQPIDHVTQTQTKDHVGATAWLSMAVIGVLSTTAVLLSLWRVLYH